MGFLLLAITWLFNPIYDVYITHPKNISIRWKSPSGRPIGSFYNLKQEYPKTKFATNGGIFMAEGLTPCGLLVQDGKVLRPVKRVNNPNINFGMQPQGIFAITKSGKAVILPVTADVPVHTFQYATQSAPIIVINKAINPKLTRSGSKCVRNGVGILPDGKVVFLMSKWNITFHELAQAFIDEGCITALYLDGVISQSCHYDETGDLFSLSGVFIAAQ